jgi:hypothetical protein
LLELNQVLRQQFSPFVKTLASQMEPLQAPMLSAMPPMQSLHRKMRLPR